ncbi:MAG TPA: hypothetical protein VNU96_16750 [Burkholderiales bacterium]|jgi:hypothetical protein|nr:hypothetical protein [Burkholderiales bacterium]
MTDQRGASRQVVAAMMAAGCEVRRVKGHLFTMLVRRQKGRA